jgi:hypothetical protein
MFASNEVERNAGSQRSILTASDVVHPLPVSASAASNAQQSSRIRRRRVVPGAAPLLTQRSDDSGRKRPQKMAEIARRLGIELQTIDIHGPDDLEPASLQAAALAGVGQGNTTEEAG